MSMHDMSTIIRPVNALVDTEYERAAQLHGEAFASAHEGFGVIAEEIQEAGDELNMVVACMPQLLAAIWESRGQAIVDLADYIRDRAVNAAAECIQVAAMSRKMHLSVCGKVEA